MPPKAVKTVRDLIFYQYAKLIARAANMDGQFGFIMKTFSDLKNGVKNWSAITREDLKMLDEERKCVYCGNVEHLSFDHIIPQCIEAPVECKVHETHNLVRCCRSCNSSKGGRDVFTWFGAEGRNEVPRIVEGKFLKLAYECHECRGTLDATDLDSNGILNIEDLGAIFRQQCPKAKGEKPSNNTAGQT